MVIEGQSISIKCEFESRSDEVYSIQHYVIKFVSDLRQVGGFSPGTPVFSTHTKKNSTIIFRTSSRK